MYGCTTPASESGTLVLMNAELLAGLVFSQLVKEKSKIILGSLPAAFNMTMAGSVYTTSSYLLNLACAEMMHFYKVPHCGTSGCGIGWGTDLLADGALWMNHLTSCIGKVGCAPFVGGNFDSRVFSPSLVVLSDQIIKEARKFANGFSLNDNAADITGINHTGPGGNYLTSEQTLASLAGIYETSSIWPALNLESWKNQGMPKAENVLTEYTKNIYEKATEASDENRDLMERGEELIKKIDR